MTDPMKEFQDFFNSLQQQRQNVLNVKTQVENLKNTLERAQFENIKRESASEPQDPFSKLIERQGSLANELEEIEKIQEELRKMYFKNLKENQ